MTISKIRNNGVILHFDTLITTKQQLCASIDFTNEFEVAAATIHMLARFEHHPEDALEMMDVLMGPNTPNAFDKNFLKDQFNQYPYVARSYFEGTSPANGYQPTELDIQVLENPYSRQEEDYVRLLLKSSGADSPRILTLRQKKSTKEWFLFSDSYKGLCAGIRKPEEDDPWN